MVQAGLSDAGSGIKLLPHPIRHKDLRPRRHGVSSTWVYGRVVNRAQNESPGSGPRYPGLSGPWL